jgi:hypothetical protein
MEEKSTECNERDQKLIVWKDLENWQGYSRLKKWRPKSLKPEIGLGRLLLPYTNRKRFKQSYAIKLDNSDEMFKFLEQCEYL